MCITSWLQQHMGKKILQLLIKQTHQLLAIKNMSIIDIPKYSTYKIIPLCKGNFIIRHEPWFKNKPLSEKETTCIFLSHIDNSRYANAVKQCNATILSNFSVDIIYCVPAISGTIDQLFLSTSAGIQYQQTRTT